MSEFAERAKEELVGVGLGKECIAAARVVVDVLTPFGITVRPLSVKVCALNSTYVRQAKEFGRSPQREEFWPGAWSVGIGFGDPEPGEWSGHLALMVEGHTLLDLTLDQAARPEHGIHLPPFLIWEVNKKFLRGNFIVELAFEAEDLVVVTYKAFPNDKTYNATPLWTDRKSTNRVTTELAKIVNRQFKT